MKQARIVRLLAAVLILATAGLLYHQQQRKAEIAELIPGCGRPEADPEAAIRDCTELLAVSGHSSEDLSAIHRFRGRAHVKLEDFATALADFEQAALANPDYCRVWQWQSDVLDELDQTQAAFDAIEKANELCPSSEYTIRQRFYLLKALDRQEEAKVFLAGLVEKYQSTDEENRVWMARLLGELLLDVEQYDVAADVFKAALLEDLNHAETLRNFFGACSIAGMDCPPLFPAQRGDYSELSCEDAVTRLGELYPKFVDTFVPEEGFGSLNDYFDRGEVQILDDLRFLQIGPTYDVAWTFPSEFAEKFIVGDRVFACVLNGELLRPAALADRDAQTYSNKRLYTPQVRANLLDLAHAALNQ